ncbi:MAG TPA: hypothetical protein VNJ54_15120 [Plantibacter sp.]|uniref:hypothetical protein n=1 Tax=Plantibacter sp. TaxID=1871045 RepID=UPI002C029ADE|nr:hypothetical protein [Plantibacter sp.]
MENVEKLAAFFDRDTHFILHGGEQTQLDRIEAKLDELLRREPLRDADRRAVADLDDIPDAPPSVSNEPVDVPSDRRTP